MKIVKQSNEHAGEMALRYAGEIKISKSLFTYPEMGMVDAHGALQTWAYQMAGKGYYAMRSSFGSAIVEIEKHADLPQLNAHPVQW